MNIGLIFKCIMSLPKTIYFNFKCLPLNQAIYMPIIVSYRTKLKIFRGGVKIVNSKVYPGMIHIGISEGSFNCGKNMPITLQLQKQSCMIFYGKASIAAGVIINNAGKIEFGEKFSSNYGLFITCSDSIVFGDNCLLGWNNHFLDNNGHRIYDINGKLTSGAKKIHIGNNVWITSETHFLKGSKIGDGCVVGYNAFMQKDYSAINNALIAGNPAVICRADIRWER